MRPGSAFVPEGKEHPSLHFIHPMHCCRCIVVGASGPVPVLWSSTNIAMPTEHVLHPTELGSHRSLIEVWQYLFPCHWAAFHLHQSWKVGWGWALSHGPPSSAFSRLRGLSSEERCLSPLIILAVLVSSSAQFFLRCDDPAWSESWQCGLGFHWSGHLTFSAEALPSPHHPSGRPFP